MDDQDGLGATGGDEPDDVVEGEDADGPASVERRLPAGIFAALEDFRSRPLFSSAVLGQMSKLSEQLAKQLQPDPKVFANLRWLADYQKSVLAPHLSQTMELIASSQAPNYAAISRMLADWPSPAVDPSVFDALRRSWGAYVPRSKAGAYSSGPAVKDSYSEALTSTGAYFDSREVEVKSFEDLNKKIVDLISKAEDLQLVWRGQQNAEWGVHSSLYRRLMQVNRVRPPGGRAKGPQPYPTEDQMVVAEQLILQAARRDWRLDGTSALETFARIQHAGGSTRLIDVTKNPFIGAWFAVESSPDQDDNDARLFAFATAAPLAPGEVPPDTQIELDSEWGSHLPPWHEWTEAAARQSTDWGTGSNRRLWVPRTYDSRIAAQNAAFILDGVPIPAGRLGQYFTSSNRKRWTRADILAAGSIYLKTASPTVKQKPNKFNIAPVFTFRITAAAKPEIRRILTERFGYTTSYIYPDVMKLAEHVKTMPLPSLKDLAPGS